MKINISKIYNNNNNNNNKQKQKLAQRDYKKRQDTLAQVVHWELRKVCHLHSSKWYKHSPEGVSNNEEVKLSWNFNIQMDHKIHCPTPDITTHEKNRNKVLIMDIAVTGDSNIKSKEKEKHEKYQDLARERSRLWIEKVKVVWVIVGALGVMQKELKG